MIISWENLSLGSFENFLDLLELLYDVLIDLLISLLYQKKIY